ncbi:endonuclease/exonuclease/phosphatase family protein [Mycetocola zhadangensis]|uniref:Endonuclease/exonuclease/phosphatase family protein n=1 Tax=Mycetocola zhadangensis TaxID=1164595 RepID=A0A3L7J1G0_9MICO|nr:endonuclease/exonuclease/phosphatase family protein [Mycetocola zhadangensis]RLQ84353.1 endonuclease/exonuclease/phosphatase family protein [Mycetocola zhadangensis]GGE93758.1 metal-dependent hydrolase [Mycetocola zhadangensis]
MALSDRVGDGIGDGAGDGAAGERAMIGPIEPDRLHVMSWNIRRPFPHLAKRHPDRWEDRKWLLIQLLAREQPSVIGMQEVMPDQLHVLETALGPSWQWVGYGRNPDHGGEHCPIFFDTSRLSLDSWKQVALSATPGVPGSRSWGNLIPRVAVVARFTDRATGLPIQIVNAHLDHLSRKSRYRSARLLGELAASASGAVVVMGDMNTTPRSLPYRYLTGEGGLFDSWQAAKTRLTEAWTTYSGYRPPKRGGKRIDWILVNDAVEVDSAGINAVRFSGAAASDHEPVQAVLHGKKE